MDTKKLKYIPTLTSDMNELRNLIIEITGYVINNNIELHRGKTFGIVRRTKTKNHRIQRNCIKWNHFKNQCKIKNKHI